MLPENLTEEERLQADVIQMKAAFDATPKNARAWLLAGLVLQCLSWRSANSGYNAMMPWLWFACYSLVTAVHDLRQPMLPALARRCQALAASLIGSHG